MKTANNIKELAELLKAGETQIKIGFDSCNDLYRILLEEYKVDLCDYDISNWDVSGVTNMFNMFEEAFNFNQNISNWDVSSVTNMSFMFYDATSFNQDLDNWNVGKVTDMRYMFCYASKFDKDISKWDVSKVTDMSYMFRHCPIEEGFKPKGVIK